MVEIVTLVYMLALLQSETECLAGKLSLRCVALCEGKRVKRFSENLIEASFFFSMVSRHDQGLKDQRGHLGVS